MGVTYTTATGATYVPLATYTVTGSSSTSVVLSSIPATYTDLVVVYSAKAATIAMNIGIQFNGDTSTNYSNTSLEGNGTSATSQRFTSVNFIRPESVGPETTGNFNTTIVNIFNYANTTTYKTTLTRNGNATNGVDALVGLWRATPAAIYSINFFARNDAIAIGSTFTLYGILSA